MATSEKLILIDGSGFIFRAYHSLPPLTRGDGTPVGAVYGVTNMLIRLLEDMPSSHVAVIFDAARKTFRNDLYPEYKAHRPPAPDDLVPQFAIVREATEALGLPALELKNFEADDIIATYATQATAQNMDTVIVSSDKDLMQLIDDNISMYDAMKRKNIGPDEVFEKFGVTPEQVTEAQALIGDSSDNVPGVPGIGAKGAAQLINEFHDLEGVLAAAPDMKKSKRKENLIEFAEQARISRELVTLKRDCENLPPISELVCRDPDIDVLLAFLQEQNFKSLHQRMAQKVGAKVDFMARTSDAATDGEEGAAPKAPVITEIKYSLVQDVAELEQWIERARKRGYVAFDTETNSLDAMQAEFVGFSLSIDAGEACYVPLNHKELVEVKAASQGDLFGGGDGDASTEQKAERIAGQIDETEALRLLAPLLTDPAVLKIGQNIKYDMLILKQRGIDIAPIDDTMLISYCQGAGKHRHNMDALSEQELGVSPVPFKEVAGTGKSAITFDFVPLDKACGYAAEDADLTLRLWQAMKPRLVGKGLMSVYERMERPLVSVITAMEQNGISVDEKQLVALSSYFAEEMARLETEIHAAAGETFNIGSPKQLGEILFEKMGIEGGKQSKKTGAYATGADVLEELAASGHVIAEKVVAWRQMTKLKSTYSDALQAQINPNTKRVHTSFSLAATSTGRLSSSDPNLQNIPVRTAEGQKIREAFVAADGCKLMSADYSQIELRLLAHVADIAPLKDAFREGKDIHATTAAQMFGLSMAEVTPDLRRQAKTINFGIIYGISAHGLAQRLGIERLRAAEYIELYFEQYPGIKAYMEQAKEQAHSLGFVTTLWGRRCHLPNIDNKNGMMRQMAERAAINAPLQGAAADIIKRAMIAVDKVLRDKNAKSKMLLQVHDELIFDIANDEEEWLPPLIVKAMENAAHLDVPLVVDFGVGEHWGEIH